jgi:BlaI family transcriptional regulator, penicillinase repressor
MKIVKPSNLEMQVLAVLWRQGSATARQVMEALPDGKDRAYTTVLSVMQVMEKKGLLKHQTDGNRHVYAPTVQEKEVMGPFLDSLVSNVFSGKASHVMMHLLEHASVSAQEVAEMRVLLEQYASDKAEVKNQEN